MTYKIRNYNLLSALPLLAMGLSNLPVYHSPGIKFNLNRESSQELDSANAKIEAAQQKRLAAKALRQKKI